MLKNRKQIKVPHSMFHMGVEHKIPCKKQLFAAASLDQELLPPPLGISPTYKAYKNKGIQDNSFKTSSHYLQIQCFP
jgi:hypothetical protein